MPTSAFFRQAGTVCFVALAVTSCSKKAEERALPRPGPQHEGLELRLDVTNQVTDGEDVHHICLEIANTGSVAVVLLGASPSGDYKEYMQRHVTYTTAPEIMPEGFQIKVQQEEPAVVHLDPVKSVVAQWEARGRGLSSYSAQQATRFPTDGLFRVRAHLSVAVLSGDDTRDIQEVTEVRRRAADFKSIQLSSNDQPFVVGGSRKTPKKCVATVVTWQEEDKSVVLDVGSRDGIEKGDVFGLPYWRVSATEVLPDRSYAVVAFDSSYASKDPKPEHFRPRTGSKLRLRAGASSGISTPATGPRSVREWNEARATSSAPPATGNLLEREKKALLRALEEEKRKTTKE